MNPRQPPPTTPSTFSNRPSLPLIPVASSIYTCDRAFYWNTIDVSCRSTIINLGKDKWFVHSPVGIDEFFVKAWENLLREGEEGEGNDSSSKKEVYVFTPNYEHLKYAPEWFEFSKQNPHLDFKFFGSPGVSNLLPTITPFHEIPSGYTPPSNLPSSLPFPPDQLLPMHVDCEVNPFTGKPFFSETIFFHVPTRTLLTTDLFWNYPSLGPVNGQLKDSIGYSLGEDFGTWDLAPSALVPRRSRAWKIGMDLVFAPFYGRFMVKDDGRMREIVEVIMGEWEPEVIVPAHGDVIRGGKLCRKVLERHFKRWM
ncbi:hypothetical protein TrRE_jg13393 [Triparma retinervis]|uniref:Uncharacterized protein n=1 Tax=Triparma retinervis TaxID=2557542 RepID=A0A9W7DT25_9STRA|nr:hypothetical protein TrRE_jg13393 [Triparma retinervis]